MGTVSTAMDVGGTRRAGSPSVGRDAGRVSGEAGSASARPRPQPRPPKAPPTAFWVRPPHRVSLSPPGPSRPPSPPRGPGGLPLVPASRADRLCLSGCRRLSPRPDAGPAGAGGCSERRPCRLPRFGPFSKASVFPLELGWRGSLVGLQEQIRGCAASSETLPCALASSGPWGRRARQPRLPLGFVPGRGDRWEPGGCLRQHWSKAEAPSAGVEGAERAPHTPPLPSPLSPGRSPAAETGPAGPACAANRWPASCPGPGGGGQRAGRAALRGASTPRSGKAKPPCMLAKRNPPTSPFIPPRASK